MVSALRTPQTGPVVDPFGAVVGNAAVVEQLRRSATDPVHAYLLVGPRNGTARDAAFAFAAAVLSHGLDPEAASRAASLALAREHPDLTVIERVGPAISAEQADTVVRVAGLRPVEGDRKVIILDELHLVDARVVPKLLKTIEEPPPGTVFVILAEQVTPELVTIASRCVRLELAPLRVDEVAAALEHEGVDAGRAEQAASLAGGDLERARLLATDPGLEERRAAWWSLPDRLDGTGHAVVQAVDGLLALIDAAQAPLDDRHRAEVEQLEARAEALGERGAGRRDLEARHKREVRRHRTDELRFGLAVLAGRCRDEARTAARPEPWLVAHDAVTDLLLALRRNPAERLALLDLCLRLNR